MIKIYFQFAVVTFFAFCLQGNWVAADTGPLLQKGNARVIIVGDSITGHSRNWRGVGFAFQLEDAIKAIYPDAKPDIIALGGSGQGIGSWLNVEKTSRTKSVTLDVRGIDAKQALGQPADVLVIMLGMNDVLAPHVNGANQKSIDGWQKKYEQLIKALVQRITPRVIGLAEITPTTEELTSPRNKFIATLNKRIAIIAKKFHARVLPTGETVQAILKHGRTLRPDFHVTRDFVHPNKAGHIGIAIGILQGLGERKAAHWLREKRLSKIWKNTVGNRPSISWQVIPEVSPMSDWQTSESQTFRIRYWWPQTNSSASEKPRVELVAPKGWQVSPRSHAGFSGEFTAIGRPEQLKNSLILQGNIGNQKRRAKVTILTPWLIAAKLVQRRWNGVKFQADKGRTPIDQAIEAGADFTGAIDVGHGQKLRWQRYYPSVNFTGLDDPGSVDFVAITLGCNFEGGYGARWIHSDRARDIQLKLNSKIFAGKIHLTVWLNGETLYKGMITAESNRSKNVHAKLRQGSNVLVFKANHRAWQWQVKVGIDAVQKGDSLADLRYSTTPPPLSYDQQVREKQ